jgi:hypothetical protein
MAVELTKDEKINRIIKSMKYKHGINEDNPKSPLWYFWNRTFDPIMFNEKDLNAKIKLPDSLLRLAVPIPYPYTTINEALEDPKYQYPEYRLEEQITIDVNGTSTRGMGFSKYILDITGYTEVPVSTFEDGIGEARRNVYGYFLYEGKCYINPQNVYYIGSTVITLERYKEVTAIRQQLTGLPPADGWYLLDKYDWQRWVLTNYFNDAELTAAVAAYKPIYDYFGSQHVGYVPYP